MPKRTLLRLASLLAGITAILGLTLAPAYADTGTGGITILYASQDQSVHKCNVIGSDQYGNTAVVCTDLYIVPSFDGASNTPLYPYFVSAGVEAYCQNSADVVVQCANIIESEAVADAAGDVVYASKNCGHSSGACPAGRYTDYTTTNGTDDGYLEYDESDDCATNPDSAFDVWSVVWGDGVTSIELPKSDKTVYLGSGNANDGSNESSGHYYACF
jgi:hypothetical protein